MLSKIVPDEKLPEIVILALVPVALLPVSNTCCNVFVVDAGVIQETPDPVDDKTCPAVPIVVPSETVDDNITGPLNVFCPPQEFIPNEVILLPAVKLVVLVPVKVIPNVVLFPAFRCQSYL